VVVRNGVVEEVRMYFDVFGFLSQLGAIPAGAATARPRVDRYPRRR
jgi:hypothetical protein